MKPDLVATRGIARTYQNIRLFPELTAVENVLVGLDMKSPSTLLGTLFNTPAHRANDRAVTLLGLDLLRFVGLAGRGDRLARHLAYGEQRRLEIARALAISPAVLLLDEPAAGMNPVESGGMMELIRRVRDELGVSILLIEHQMRVVMGVSDRVTVLDHGVPIAEGTPDEVRGNDAVITAYLGSRAARHGMDAADRRRFAGLGAG